MRYRNGQEEFTREIVGTGTDCFAVVSIVRNKRIESVEFALPPDGIPTGKLWVMLERVLKIH